MNQKKPKIINKLLKIINIFLTFNDHSSFINNLYKDKVNSLSSMFFVCLLIF